MFDYMFDAFIRKAYKEDTRRWQERYSKNFKPRIYRQVPSDKGTGLLLEESQFFTPSTNIRCMFHQDDASGLKPHQHDFFELIYVYSGEISHTVADRSYTLSAGDICIVNPHTNHCLARPTPETIIINVLIRIRFLNQLYNTFSATDDVAMNFFFNCFYRSARETELLLPHKLTEKTTVLSYIHIAIREYLEQRAQYEKAASYAMMLFFLEVTRVWEKQNTTALSEDARISLDDIVTYLQENFRTATLESTAAHFHYHPTYLPQYLKRQCGHTFNDILQSIRLSVAKDRLMHSELTTEEIAAEIGYDNVSSFFRFFKKWTDLSPAQFRRLYKTPDV